MKKIFPYLLATSMLVGTAAYDATSQVKKPQTPTPSTQKTLDEMVFEKDGKGFVRGEIVDIDEESFLIEGQYSVETNNMIVAVQNTGRTFGNYVFEILTVKAGSKKIKLIHRGPSSFTGGDRVEFEYLVSESQRIPFGQILQGDYLYTKHRTQVGHLQARGIITEFSYF